MAKQYVLDMTKGNETSLLLRFTLPMLVGNLFQQFYNMVDSIIVGRFVGTNALGAVGSVGSINFMFFSLCLGLGSGIGILISQYFGAGQTDYVKKIIANAIYITLGTGVLMSLCGVIFADPISIWRYTCMESALIISPLTAFARSMERAVFPVAVGPARMIRGFFISNSSLPTV